MNNVEANDLIIKTIFCLQMQTDVENVKMVADFIFLGFKINVDGDCSHEIKRHLLLGNFMF